MFWSFLICWVESTRLIATGCEVRPKIPQISCSISRWRWTLMMVQSWWLRIRRWKTFSCRSVSIGNSNQFYYSMWPSECIWVWPRAPNLDGFHIFLLFSCCDLKTDQYFDSYPHGFVWKWILSINPYKSNGLPTTNAHIPFEPQLFFPICFSCFSLFSWPKKMDGTRVSPSLLDQGQAWRLWRLRRRAEFGLKLGLHHVEHGRTHPNPLVSFHLIISHEIPSWMIHWLTVFQIILGVPLTTGTWEPWQDDLCDPRYWKFQEVALQSDGFSMAQLKWVNRCQQFVFRHGSPDITSTKLSHLHLMCTRMHTWNFNKHYSWHSEYSDCPAADICGWHSEVHGFTPKFKVLFKVACRSWWILRNLRFCLLNSTRTTLFCGRWMFYNVLWLNLQCCLFIK